jgi:CRISPR-associated endonuclease Cas2
MTATLLVAYDITHNKARNKIIKLLNRYGTRLQKSVFYCQLDKNRAHQLTEELRNLHFKLCSGRYHKEGMCLQVAVFPLCKSCEDSSFYLGIEDARREDFLLV